MEKGTLSLLANTAVILLHIAQNQPQNTATFDKFGRSFAKISCNVNATFAKIGRNFTATFCSSRSCGPATFSKKYRDYNDEIKNKLGVENMINFSKACQISAHIYYHQYDINTKILFFTMWNLASYIWDYEMI